ncbi:hypothetical protein E0H73_39600 [Kribbella pittospori]|uniref:Uncharacterized protein n=1 Tax=Kribbella pittospori TaxID=722689 RepID=A0A4R0K526_9ACTN|nr:hypothetical protein [Kribbella pittospori]TCC54257.1 hypothetical protein E0H73_39600 [Kribbella pittospori]
MMLRLETVDPGLVAMVDGASDATRRAVAAAAVALTREWTGLNDERVLALPAAVAEGRVGDCSERRAVNSLVEELDGVQWDVQDGVDAGDATAEEHLEAFSRARAAASVAFAADDDARSAALEGLYEAAMAIDDLGMLRDAVGRVVL